MALSNAERQQRWRDKREREFAALKARRSNPQTDSYIARLKARIAKLERENERKAATIRKLWMRKSKR